MRFDSYHPAIQLLFFVSVIIASAWFNQPIFIVIAYLCSAIYALQLNGKRAAILIVILFPIMALFVGLYIYNVHFGVTNLGQTVIGNMITFEALMSGTSIAVRGAAVVLWISCFLTLFTADKVVYLFGRASPKLALFVAIIFRALPQVGKQAHIIGTAQRCVGRGTRQGNLFSRCRNWVRQFSMLITWSIEHFAYTADSMQSRGSNLSGRSAYSLFRFDTRDRALVLTMVALITVILLGVAYEQTSMLYSPVIVLNPITPVSFIFYLSYMVFCLLPFGLQVYGQRKMNSALKKMNDFSTNNPRSSQDPL